MSATPVLTRDGTCHAASAGPSGPSTRCGREEPVYVAGESPVDCRECLTLPEVTPVDLRLHGAGDGSVMAYCGPCRNPLPILPRPLTLDALLSAWAEHARQHHTPGRPS